MTEKRIPGLRSLRRKCPANVVILPTAAERKVQQHYGRKYVAAKRAMIASQPVEFPYQLPFWRAAEREAQSPELRADVPPFDPGNPAHLRAWEALWDARRRIWRSDPE
jgi:hypothetical protein